MNQYKRTITTLQDLHKCVRSETLVTEEIGKPAVLEALETAIEAVEYRDKKPIERIETETKIKDVCPICGEQVWFAHKHCPKCGQALRKGDENGK